ncbi:MAG TPA: redoxin domain-containing protein [Opitutaceae bacterium]|nr:redoxin domain-containing protein [Opitutaceae bacterium]
MKTLLRFVVVGVAFVAALAGRAVESGQPAPDFAFTDIAGQSHKLSDFKGKVVVLEWVNPECPIARKHYESHNMQATQQAALDDGAVWISINSAGYDGAQGNYDNAKAAAWLKDMGFKPTAYVRDLTGKIGHLYHATNTPHMFVINKDGTLVYQGAIDSGNGSGNDIATSTNYVKAALASLKSGQPIAKPATKAYGCSVKYGQNGS